MQKKIWSVVIATQAIILRIFVLNLVILLGFACQSTRSHTMTTQESTPEQLVHAQNKLGLSVVSKQAEKKENTCISPTSLWQSLGLLWLGADKDSERALAALLAEGSTFPKTAVKDWNDALKNDALGMYPGLWVAENYALNPDYLEACKAYFQAASKQINFSQTQASADQINQRIAEQTEGRITQLVSPEMLGGNTRLLLTHALYFKNKWKKAFPKSETAQGRFTLANGEEIQVPFMALGDTLSYLRREEYQVLKLPYEAHHEMMLLLPHPNISLESWLQTLALSDLMPPNSAFQRRKVELKMPKFSFESRWQAKADLSEMGLSTIFDAQKADLSGITERERLYVSEIVQQVYLEVEEEGTEAAVGTGVVIKTRKASKDLHFLLNRPFLFTIFDKDTGSILLLGTVYHP